jgi:type I restriction enzyme R subunit
MYILRQHQIAVVQKIADRFLDLGKHRDLVWHTQGSGMTFTIIKAADLLFRVPDGDKQRLF